jgi:hypothetical protein
MAEIEKKYRIQARAYPSYNNGTIIKYVIQRRWILGIWITISDELSGEQYANDLCDKFNKYNCHDNQGHI